MPAGQYRIVARKVELVRCERLPEVFEHGATAQREQAERQVARLEQKLRQLTMKLDWLKKIPSTGDVTRRAALVLARDAVPSLRRQCEMLADSSSQN